ncbi:MAG: winged helix-turn-helix transcriptional regulator [Sinobacteraceae bacterium]|nr:winged helix-turn-helix transcriptional regulator [Nevskiaceae bacterium]
MGQVEQAVARQDTARPFAEGAQQVELRARHRDPRPESVRGFCFGGWRLDTVTRTLSNSEGRELALSGAEYRLLAVLLGAGNRVLTRAQLTELLRGRDADPFDRSIDVRVSRLRQILGDDARAPQIIKTVYGEGYVIGVNVATE